MGFILFISYLLLLCLTKPMLKGYFKVYLKTACLGTSCPRPVPVRTTLWTAGWSCTWFWAHVSISQLDRKHRVWPPLLHNWICRVKSEPGQRTQKYPKQGPCPHLCCIRYNSEELKLLFIGTWRGHPVEQITTTWRLFKTGNSRCKYFLPAPLAFK